LRAADRPLPGLVPDPVPARVAAVTIVVNVQGCPCKD
jgi:hypothetical protein